MATKMLREKMSEALSESERKRREEERRRRKQQQEQEALNAQTSIQQPQKKWEGIDLSLPEEFHNGVRAVLIQEHQDEIKRDAQNDDLKSSFMDGMMEAQYAVRESNDFGSGNEYQRSYDDVVYEDVNTDDSDSLEAGLEITEPEVIQPEISTEAVRRERALPSIAYEMGLADMELQSESSRPLPSMGEELLAQTQSGYHSEGTGFDY